MKQKTDFKLHSIDYEPMEGAIIKCDLCNGQSSRWIGGAFVKGNCPKCEGVGMYKNEQLAKEISLEIRFPVGECFETYALSEVYEDENIASYPTLTWDYIARHERGDWGILPEERKKANEFNLVNALPVMSIYKTPKGVSFMIVTEADRHRTIACLPSEYLIWKKEIEKLR